MGLLSQILGGLAGNVLGRSSAGRTSGGVSRVLMSLLPVVLGMLANRQGGRIGRGGVSDLRGGSLGGLGGAGAIGGLGGLGGLLEQFIQKGYGSQANSWVSTGPNQPISPEALSDVFGQERLSQIATQAGVSDDEAREGLAELLPEVVDHFTPQGEIPAPDQLVSSIDEYERQMSR